MSHRTIRPAAGVVARLMLTPLAAGGLLLLAACGADTAGGADAPPASTPAAAASDTTDHDEHGRHAADPAATGGRVDGDADGERDGGATTIPTLAPIDRPTTTAPPAEPATTTTLAAAPAPSRLEIVGGEYHFELSSDVVAAGPVQIALTNVGVEPHQVHVAAVPDGFTAADVVGVFETEGELALFDRLQWAGGVSGVEPGATVEATAELLPGNYVVICFLPTPGSTESHGVSHLQLGMVHELEVVDAAAAPAAAPVADTTITLSDFAIDLPAGFAGGEVAVVNAGSEPHELVFMRFDEGKSLADLAAWSAAGMPAERPFAYAGGTGTLAAGARGWATLALTPGDYVALCVVRGPTDQPHVEMGMLLPFTVA